MIFGRSCSIVNQLEQSARPGFILASADAASALPDRGWRRKPPSDAAEPASDDSLWRRGSLEVEASGHGPGFCRQTLDECWLADNSIKFSKESKIIDMENIGAVPGDNQTRLIREAQEDLEAGGVGLKVPPMPVGRESAAGFDAFQHPEGQYERNISCAELCNNNSSVIVLEVTKL